VSNGNTTEVERCERSIPNTLCFGNDDTVLFDTAGWCQTFSAARRPVDTAPPPRSVRRLGKAPAAPLFGRQPVVVGASLDHAEVDLGDQRAGTINTSTCGGRNRSLSSAPRPTGADSVGSTSNSYYGLYATDTFDVTSRLAVTLAARYNLALIR
jgi:iron complex outermembrane receptor protein